MQDPKADAVQQGCCLSACLNWPAITSAVWPHTSISIVHFAAEGRRRIIGVRSGNLAAAPTL